MQTYFSKINSIYTAFFCFIFLIHIKEASAQGPQISMVGNSPSLTKGTINTEVLSEIIQQKQDELNQKIFRNIIIKNFNTLDYEQKFSNFTSYYYLYNLMNNIISGKNKTLITKNIMESSTEFAYVFGLTWYIQESLKLNQRMDSSFNIKLDRNLLDNAKVNYNNQKISVSENIEQFNVLIDVCYDVILTNKNVQSKFQFKENLNNESFKRWYQSTNVYQLKLKTANAQEKAELLSLHKYVEGKLIDLLNLINTAEQIKAGDTIPYPYNLAVGQYKAVVLFYSNLKKSDFEEFTLKQSQYFALKFLLKQFTALTNNQFENNLVSKLLNTTQENTLVEYANALTNMPVLEQNAKNNDNGYLYIDVESIISEMYQKIDAGKNKGLSVYLSPFFSIGTNYASFTKTNRLIQNADGTSSSLSNIYFASEKIGLKWKLYNWEYTHSHSVGDNFKYYNFKKRTYRYWKRPQMQPTVSNVHIIVYGSGLLYNIANLKSNENFNYAIVGTGLGITLFNGLSANVGIACPYTDKKFNSNNSFINFGIDIPIVEYIAGLKRK